MKRRTFDWVEHVEGDYRVKPDLGEFTHLRLFHGCRPIDLPSYYEQGILVMPLEELARQFRNIYCDFPSNELEQAIAQVNRRENESRVDAALDLRFLIRFASHYFTYGSETLQAFAVKLPIVHGECPKERLKSVGVPTAFVVDAPLDRIHSQTLDELQVKLTTLAEKGRSEVCSGDDMIAFTVSFPEGVPPTWLVRHEIVLEARSH